MQYYHLVYIYLLNIKLNADFLPAMEFPPENQRWILSRLLYFKEAN